MLREWRASIGARQLKAWLRRPAWWLARRRRRLASDHHYFAVCAIFKDEARFLREWILFHRNVGVAHFYLYNNNSSDHFRDVLAEFDCVTVIDWPSIHRQQRGAYLDCVKRFGGQCRWIAFIDIDEFLFSPNGGSVLPVLSAFHDRPAVLATSFRFGANGIAKIPQYVLSSFTRRASDLSGKSIVDPRAVRQITNAHVFRYYGKVGHGEPPADVLRINHYWVRSYEEITLKCRRGDVWGDSPREHREIAWVREEENSLNEIEDTTIQPFAVK